MQLQLDFDGGLTQQFPSWEDVLHAAAYANPLRRPFKHVAADMGLSPGELSKMLSHGEGRHFPGELLPQFLEATGDLRPVYWLIEKFLPTDEQRADEAVRRLERLMADVIPLVADIKRAKR